MNNRILNKLLKQKAVYWGSPVNDGQGGYTYADPVEIKVKWSDKQEKFITIGAEEQVSKTVLFLAQDVEVKGMISLGLISDLSSSELPEDNNAFEIKGFANMPERTGQNSRRKAWL